LQNALRFGRFEIRPAERLLLDDGVPAELGARAFDLLLCLIAHRDRVVTKDEALLSAWSGRVVEENNLSVQVSSLRKVIGSKAIATIPGRGYRFVLPVTESVAPPLFEPRVSGPGIADPRAIDGRNDAAAVAPRRGSVSVMPFVDHARSARVHGGVADALAYDVISRLARLRSLFVIAQGTVFALHERGIGPQEAGRILNVDYVVSGSVRTHGNRRTISVELAETRSARIVWVETFDHALDNAFVVFDEICNQIVASIASEIETNERNRALLKPPSSLDAWEAHHRGLWHMYRYRKADNDKARHFFQTALRLDPAFSRAWAGLSFTHFQSAFQNWGPRGQEIDLAYDAAAQGLMADERDPAVHWAMGRALWLLERPDESLVEMGQSIELSPNFALGHYNLSFVHSIVGDARAAIAFSDRSRHLSPYDPMLFGMLATRAMALVRLGQIEEAADWAVKAAARPNAFPHIQAIAAFSLALAGSLDQARTHAAAARKMSPRYSVAEFLTTFPFEPEGEALFRRGAQLIGMT
jgi:tetratricopeptide (TPR) repeat protein